ncbi:MAG: hypothetical protein ACLQD8_04895 [Thermoplasmata archaeon]
MGIPIDIPGLNTIIPEIGEGRVVIVESGADLTNSYFVRHLGGSALGLGRPVTFVTSKDRGEVQETLKSGPAAANGSAHHARILEMDSVANLDELAPEGGLLAVDSFSFLTLGLSSHDLAHLLRRLHAVCRGRRCTAVLTTDRGMFDPRAEAIVIHLADGFIQFHARDGAEGVVRFLRIPKWTDGKFFDRNIYYEFDGKRIAIDLRSRVL